MKGYVFKVLLYIDILIQSLIWRDANITISARCGIALKRGYPWGWVKLGKILNFISKDHCEKSIHYDIKRAEETMKILRDWK